MTKNEMSYVAAFLDVLADRFGNDGCNDMSLPDTQENRELVSAAESGDRKKLSVHDGKIMTYNFLIVEYLKHKIMDEFGLENLVVNWQV